jgi:hypothetical protein
LRGKRIAITPPRPNPKRWGALFLALTLTTLPALTHAQQLSATQAQSPQRTRLILKDGTYQLVLSYTVSGDLVRYRSAERNGEPEDIPLALVDLPATEKWAQEHAPGAAQRAPVLSPELAKEEADRAERTPEVAPGLRLPKELSVLALDTFNSAPELIPLVQQGGDLNKETAHNVLKAPANSASSRHRLLDISGDRADAQLHLAAPVFYVRLGTSDATEADSGTITVDAQEATARSSYKIERLEIRGDVRVLNSFRLDQKDAKRQPDVIEVQAETLPGGHWLKLSPANPLAVGEYALVEVLPDHEINLGVWDFGIHPEARDNDEAIRPDPKRSAVLKDRP